MHRSHTTMIALFVCIFMFCAPAGLAQDKNDYLDRVGVPNFAVMEPVELGSINLANGGLHLEIPVASLAQRGPQPFTIKLIYDSQLWGHSSPQQWFPNAMIGSMGG